MIIAYAGQHGGCRSAGLLNFSEQLLVKVEKLDDQPGGVGEIRLDPTPDVPERFLLARRLLLCGPMNPSKSLISQRYFFFLYFSAGYSFWCSSLNS